MQGKKENKDTTSATQATHKLHLLFEFVDYGFYSVKSSLVLSFSNALVKQKTGKWICLICVLLFSFFFSSFFFLVLFFCLLVCACMCVLLLLLWEFERGLMQLLLSQGSGLCKLRIWTYYSIWCS